MDSGFNYTPRARRRPPRYGAWYLPAKAWHVGGTRPPVKRLTDEQKKHIEDSAHYYINHSKSGFGSAEEEKKQLWMAEFKTTFEPADQVRASNGRSLYVILSRACFFQLPLLLESIVTKERQTLADEFKGARVQGLRSRYRAFVMKQPNIHHLPHYLIDSKPDEEVLT